MGAGKSSLAPLLAQRLGCEWRDTDALIEQRIGMAGGEIIRDLGMTRFRQIEEQVACEALRQRACVIATGAGAWLSAEIRSMAATTAISIWLEAQVKTLARRLSGSDRYLVSLCEPFTLAARQLEERGKTYAQADLRLSTDGRTPIESVNDILACIADPRLQLF